MNLKIAILLAIVVMFGGCGFKSIDPGHRGIEIRFGEIQGAPKPEGLYFYNPFTTSLLQLSVQEQKLSGETVSFTKDAQELHIKYSINYHPEADKIGDLYKNIGKEWAEKLLPQLIEGNMKAALGQWDAVNIVENRDKATRRAEEQIRAAAAARNIVVTRLELTNIDFNKDFQNAIEAKVKAQQLAEQAKNETVMILEQARQRIIKAEAEAKSIEIRTKALEKSPALIQYEAVQKWDGRLPQYMLGSGAVPFINLPVGEPRRAVR